ncbi:MAG: hypothetical protein KC713_05845 [Candidatus Omnitrophica bacterium]|nr:hypothetical protein [Candidatus Omnitrophota bacterium]
MKCIFFVIILSFALINYSAAQECVETNSHHVFSIHGEVSGQRSYYQSVDEKWTFQLIRENSGWTIGLLDPQGRDATRITPPLKFGHSPKDIFGWHFRDVSNQRMNDGSVNAAQYLREFDFITPSINEVRLPDDAQRSANQGSGWLNVLDFGLNDLQPGMKARLTYLKFHVCLMWPKTKEEKAAEEDFQNPNYTDEEKEMIYGCGLSDRYQPRAFIKPRMFQGDFDGDGSFDIVVPIIRKLDGKKGLAVCRGGTWLGLLGVDGGVGEQLSKDYFDQIEAWFVKDVEQTEESAINFKKNVNPQVLKDGVEVIILERLEKSRYVLYWDGHSWQSFEDYLYVEP